MSFSTFTLDNPGSVPSSYKSDRFKGEEGKEYRISSFGGKGIEDGSPSWIVPLSLLLATVCMYRALVMCSTRGLSFSVSHSKLTQGEEGSPCNRHCDRLLAFKDGRPDKTALANGEYKVMPWVLSEDKVKSILRKHQEWPL